MRAANVSGWAPHAPPQAPKERVTAAVLKELATGDWVQPKTIELAIGERLSLTLPALSVHLAGMRDRGLIEIRGNGRARRVRLAPTTRQNQGPSA